MLSVFAATEIEEDPIIWIFSNVMAMLKLLFSLNPSSQPKTALDMCSLQPRQRASASQPASFEGFAPALGSGSTTLGQQFLDEGLVECRAALKRAARHPLPLILRLGRAGAVTAAVLVTAVAVGWAWPTLGWLSLITAPFVFVFSYFLVESYAEIIQIISEMTH